jgi:microcystin-dependent protein
VDEDFEFKNQEVGGKTMSNPYVGEIRMFAGNFAPVGWAFCQGQLMAISENDTLFNLIGTTYGGDGQSTFALPNLSSRIPLHMGTNLGQTYIIGQMAGEEQVTLTTNQIPSHTHTAVANTSGDGISPSAEVWGGSTDVAQFAAPASINGQMSAQAIQPTGGSQPHDNMIPFLCVNFIISLYGVYPTPT